MCYLAANMKCLLDYPLCLIKWSYMVTHWPVIFRDWGQCPSLPHVFHNFPCDCPWLMRYQQLWHNGLRIILSFNDISDLTKNKYKPELQKIQLQPCDVVENSCENFRFIGDYNITRQTLTCSSRTLCKMVFLQSS